MPFSNYPKFPMPPVVRCNYEVAIVLRVPPRVGGDSGSRLEELNLIASLIAGRDNYTWHMLRIDNILGAIDMNFESGENRSCGRWQRGVSSSISPHSTLMMIDSLGFNEYADAATTRNRLVDRLSRVCMQGDCAATLRVYIRVSSYDAFRSWVDRVLISQPTKQMTLNGVVELYTRSFSDSIAAMATRFNRLAIGPDVDVLFDLLHSYENPRWWFECDSGSLMSDQLRVMYVTQLPTGA